jgi:hypothetical protein
VTIEWATRLAEVILGFALLLQSLEAVRAFKLERILGAIRLVLAMLLVVGVQPLLIESGLLLTSLILLRRFHGPYNGGSDTMTLLVLLCLWLTHWVPVGFWQEIALGYLAVQLILSYFQSGWVKLVNADWRSGRALQQVFALSAYPVSEKTRLWALQSRLLLYLSWLVIGFELLFPLAFLHHTLLLVALIIAGTFHLANAWLFGLNRFFWIWPAAYPVLIWLQGRLLGAN